MNRHIFETKLIKPKIAKILQKLYPTHTRRLHITVATRLTKGVFNLKFIIILFGFNILNAKFLEIFHYITAYSFSFVDYKDRKICHWNHYSLIYISLMTLILSRNIQGSISHSSLNSLRTAVRAIVSNG